MTISTTDRRRDFLRTLVVMVTVVADRAVMHVRFEPGQKPVEATLPTTWDELQQRGIVSDKSTLTRPQYSLTPDGWADGLVSRPPDDLQERCGRLAAALKQVVKGRELDGFTVLKDLASAAELPDGWVCNAVQGNLLDLRFPSSGFYLRGFEDGFVCHLQVPRTFGLEDL